MPEAFQPSTNNVKHLCYELVVICVTKSRKQKNKMAYTQDVFIAMLQLGEHSSGPRVAHRRQTAERPPFASAETQRKGGFFLVGKRGNEF